MRIRILGAYPTSAYNVPTMGRNMIAKRITTMNAHQGRPDLAP